LNASSWTNYNPWLHGKSAIRQLVRIELVFLLQIF